VRVNCPRCKVPVRGQARYCQSCGKRLDESPAAECARCEEELFPAARFCYSCGLPVAGASGRIDTGLLRAFAGLERLMPEPYLKQLLAARGQTRGERRVVTILFCDIEGSTAMAELLDPEEVMNVLNKAFKVLVEPVFRHEGTLARLMGDAVLAFFGAPVAHEDDAVRACRAATEIIEASKFYADELERERGIRGFNVRIGINTGLVVVGEVGTDYRVEYTAMGDAVNLAARMEASAESGTALLTVSTFELIDHAFSTADLGYIEVKGKSEPVHVFRLLTPRAAAHAEQATMPGAPFVGREAESTRIRLALEGLREGRGRTMAVVGDHGLGKSRLVAETCRTRPVDAVCVTARGAPHLQNAGFRMAGQMLQAVLGIDAHAPREEVLEALSENVSESFGTAPREGEPHPPASEKGDPLLPYLMGILDFPVAEESPALTPDLLRARIRSAFCTYLTRYSQSRPLILVWEDLTWADPSSLELIEALTPLAKSHAIVSILVFRDEEGPVRSFHERMRRTHRSAYEVIELRPLGDDDSDRLLSRLLEDRAIHESTRRLILDRAEGNAFFLEQISRSLIDAGTASSPGAHTDHLERIDVPTTVQSAVMSRIDRLHPDAKWVLQTASVVGRVFQQDVLEKLAEPELRADRLARALEELRRLGFLQTVSDRTGPAGLQETGLEGPGAPVPSEPLRIAAKSIENGSFLRAEYTFTHAMTAEVAYSSLLKSKRRELHRRTAELYETAATERIDDLAPILAHHFEKAGVPAKAYAYAVRSADRAARVHAYEETIAYYSKALAIEADAERSGPPAPQLDPPPVIVHEALAGVYHATSEYRSAIEHYDRAMTVEADERRQVTLHRKKGQVYEKWGKHEDARTEFESALAKMRKPLDPAEAAHVYSGLGMAAYHGGNLDEALQLGGIALEMMEVLDDKRGVAQACNNLGIAHCKKGDLATAQTLCERSISIWAALSDPLGLATAHNNFGLVALRQSKPQEAASQFEKAIVIFEKLGNRHGLARSYDNLSQASLDQERKDEAVDYMKKAVAILAEISSDATEIVPEMWQSGAW
jgi:class 3 adenylate cyclase/tetratricopeptide (TPR) repeat protein